MLRQNLLDDVHRYARNVLLRHLQIDLARFKSRAHQGFRLVVRCRDDVLAILGRLFHAILVAFLKAFLLARLTRLFLDFLSEVARVRLASFARVLGVLHHDRTLFARLFEQRLRFQFLFSHIRQALGKRFLRDAFQFLRQHLGLRRRGRRLDDAGFFLPQRSSDYPRQSSRHPFRAKRRSRPCPPSCG